MKSVLTIAGSDSGGGAGIQGDLKIFSALGLYGTTVITAITAQNTQKITSIYGIPSSIVKDQLDAVLEDFNISSGKIGMVYNQDIIEILIEHLKNNKSFPVVLDPMIISSTGTTLISESAITLMKNDLFPLVDLVTPNIPEMEIYIDQKILTLDDMKQSVEIFFDKIHTPVLLKGGHRQEDPTDIYFDGRKLKLYSEKKIDVHETHGTGCALSSAIISYIALGETMEQAILLAKDFVTKSLKTSLKIGKGLYSLNCFKSVND